MIVDTFAFGSLLHQCSRTRAFRCGLSLHAAVVKTGVQANVVVSNHILNMYAKCGNIVFARKVFEEMSERNLVTWSAMISGYDQSAEPLMAIDLFSQMRLVPNEYIFASAISACASLFARTQGQQIHAQSMKLGYSSISFVSNSLISMYMKCGGFKDALSVFSGISEPNRVSYNALITGLVENQQPESGFEVFKLMYQRGLIPDRFTFVGVLGICTSADDMWGGMELHCQTVKLNLDSTAFIGNVIITMYSKFNLVEEAMKAFELIEEKDVISWNTLITACSHCDHYAKGLSVFNKMTKENGIMPDDFTYASALAACAGLASIRHGSQIHAHLIRTRLDEDVGVSNALLNMYAKCGCIGYAYTVFNQVKCRNVVSWNSIIAGFGNHGLGEKALELFEQMKERCLQPDSVTFVGLLTACNHAGLVDKGQAYFNSMSEIYGIAPSVEHLSCLIDLLGRAGRLNEAEEYIEKFPFGHDPVILGSLLSSCRLHGDVVIGERLARRLLKREPVTTSSYVLLSNLYASDGMWDAVAEARKMLKGSGLKKEPGHSLLEVKGIVEKFTVGDFSHSKIEEIVDILKTFSWAGDEVSLYN
ncbi:pentatricopeptide repeat-containing protein At3g09040, mitochondrial-like isoform X1 [Cornus florida]|uniref:pentatricopeptide repeat-containing protein At3g09040, mitochondrial-like isoform X1 n=2 Tax=Cornus florida TaxID=4283 RepID=UPI00289AFC41|nr:pentatricopeptide repeat-containing protein At3g09040, mitochondrial-like isoform X1 [Cornus florida]